MAAHGLSIDWYVHRHRDRDEVLPWAHISAGLHEDFLWQDWQDALAAVGHARLPLDAVLRLRGLHRLRHRARRGFVDAAGRRQPGHRPGPVPGPRGAGAAAAHRGGGSPSVTRVRIRFVKLGKIRWTSHRDVARMWERAFRRVQLPLAYSAGYSPRPKVSFGLALPTGHESVAEYLDVELVDPTGTTDLDVRPLPGRLSAALPLGVDATAAEVIAPGTLSLQEDVTSCTWRWAAAPKEGTDPLGSEELAGRVDGGAGGLFGRRHPNPQGRGADRRHPGRYLQPAVARARRARSFAGRVAGGRSGLPATLPSAVRGPRGLGPRSGGTPGAEDASMDFARRRPEGAASGGGPVRRDGRAARPGACVMRRERVHVRPCVGRPEYARARSFRWPFHRFDSGSFRPA